MRQGCMGVHWSHAYLIDNKNISTLFCVYIASRVECIPFTLMILARAEQLYNT